MLTDLRDYVKLAEVLRQLNGFSTLGHRYFVKKFYVRYLEESSSSPIFLVDLQGVGFLPSVLPIALSMQNETCPRLDIPNSLIVDKRYTIYSK
jgi:hypothetical protein